jgi:hypothetical protein
MSLLLTIGSRAIPIMRTAWNVIKSSPLLNNIKNAFISEMSNKAFSMIDEKF